MGTKKRLKLIDYDEVRNQFDEEYKKTAQLIREGETHLNNLAEGFAEADKVIWKLPTVDAVEVVHARWEEIGVADYKCSRCGFRFTSADPISMFQYCRCGAKMDGGNEDGK